MEQVWQPVERANTIYLQEEVDKFMARENSGWELALGSQDLPSVGRLQDLFRTHNLIFFWKCPQVFTCLTSFMRLFSFIACRHSRSYVRTFKDQ